MTIAWTGVTVPGPTPCRPGGRRNSQARPTMPRSNVPATQETPSTSLAIPDDIRADLLRSQAEQITSAQRLPRMKVMPAGAGLFEFTDDATTVRNFEGVVLNSHPRNVLWDKPYGEGRSDQEQEGPACVANDGRYGAPRPGFKHLGLPGNRGRTPAEAEVRAMGSERIECATCPYNQWGSKGLLPELNASPTAKGKAVTNQKAVYILLSDRELPVELVLPPTSLQAFDAYIAGLLNRGIPVQSVVTKFTQVRKEQGGLRWSVVQFEQGDNLDPDTFGQVLQKRERYRSFTTPQDPANMPVEEYANVEIVAGDEVGDDEIPF